jgi:hypothetical protein
MTFEYGTLNTETFLGSAEALYRVKFENQGYQWGYADSFSERNIKSLFLEGYFPSATDWRAKIMAQAAESLPKILQRITTYPTTGAQ